MRIVVKTYISESTFDNGIDALKTVFSNQSKGPVTKAFDEEGNELSLSDLIDQSKRDAILSDDVISAGHEI